MVETFMLVGFDFDGPPLSLEFALVLPASNIGFLMCGGLLVVVIDIPGPFWRDGGNIDGF